MGHHACLRGKRAFISLEGNLLRYVCARAHLHTVMTQKSCAVGMHNAILRDHLNQIEMHYFHATSLKKILDHQAFSQAEMTMNLSIKGTTV